MQSNSTNANIPNISFQKKLSQHIHILLNGRPILINVDDFSSFIVTSGRLEKVETTTTSTLSDYWDTVKEKPVILEADISEYLFKTEGGTNNG